MTGHAACTMPAVSAEGPGTLQISLNNTWQGPWNVSYYQMWDVAIGLRPYISESQGSLLLRVDSASP